MNENLDELFNENQLNKAIKKGKLKSTIRTAIISLVVTIIVITIGSYINTKTSIIMSEQFYKENEEFVKLTVPNGYISESIDNIGFLGGTSTYKVSKAIGYKSVVVQEMASKFGYSFTNPILKFFGSSPYFPMYRGSGGYTVQSNGDGWPLNRTQTGYRRIMFFHPEIKYKNYKNDLSKLDEISDDQLIELAISFDKPYKYTKVESLLSKVHASWYWLDAYTKDDMKEQKQMAEVIADKTGTISIDEFNAIGVNVSPQQFETGYTDLINILKNTKLEKYKAIYNEMMAKGYKNYYDVPVLGAIVYGTKSELKVLIGNPAIKASSFGVITSKY